MNTRRPAGAALIATGLLAALAGCGGGTPAPPAAAPAAPTEVAASATDQVCGTMLKIDGIPLPDSGPDDQPAPADVKAWGNQLTPLLDAVVAQAPADLAPTVATLRTYIAAAADKGTNPDFDDPKFSGAANGFESWAHGNCGYQNVELTGMDNVFTGVPATLKAGPVSVALKNTDAMGQFHVALLARVKDPALTKEKIAAMPQEQLMGALEVLPAAAAAAPGQSGGALFDLTPGTYFLLCPVGDQGQAPHYMKGMVEKITVT